MTIKLNQSFTTCNKEKHENLEQYGYKKNIRWDKKNVENCGKICLFIETNIFVIPSKGGDDVQVDDRQV